MELQQAFEKASVDVKTLIERPDNETMLKLYSLFKQATEGEVQGKRPGMMNMVARAKYDAWQGLSGVSQNDAKNQYVALVQDLLGRQA